MIDSYRDNEMMIMNIHKIFLASAVLVAALVSCRKEATEEKLSTDRTVVTAVAEGGRQAVEVYASGAWTAEFAEEADWVRLSVASGDGDGELVLEFEPNDALYRFTTLVLSLSGSELRVEIEVNQESAKGSPVMNLFPPDMIYPAAGGDFGIPYSANVPLSQLSASCAEDWVGSLSVEQDNVRFALSANPVEARRTAVIWLVCTDAQDKAYRTRCTITQEAKGDRTGFGGEAGNEGYITDDDRYKW